VKEAASIIRAAGLMPGGQ